MLGRFGQQIEPLDGEVSGDKLKHPLFGGVSKAHEPFGPPDGRRQRPYQALEPLAEQRSPTQDSQSMEMVMNRSVARLSRRSGNFSFFIEHEVVVHGPVFS